MSRLSRRVFLGFSSLLVFSILTLIVTYVELAAVYSEDALRSEPAHWEIAAEWQNEEKDIKVKVQKPQEEGRLPVGLNVGRVLAKYESDQKADDNTSRPPTQRSTGARSSNHQPNTTTEVDWQAKQLHEQILYQRQLALQLNWTARLVSSSNHYRDVQGRLNTLAHLKGTELRLDTATKELWSYLRDQLRTSKPETSEEMETKLLQSVKEQLDLLSLHASHIQNIVDSYISEGWREKMSTELTQLMERRLDHLQNPTNCHRAKKLLCRLSKPCGFGCQIHHVAYCLIFAYATERILVLDQTGWRYAGSWETVFQPLSRTLECTQIRNVTTPSSWTLHSGPHSPQWIQVPAIESLGSRRPPFVPMAVPSDLIDRLKVFHGYPFVWFISQFLNYLMRPSHKLRSFLDERRARLNVTHPIVGVHIRRTDKLQQEASYHSVKEYMTQVEEWYDWRSTTLGGGRGSEWKEERRVYLATDDKDALKSAREEYPDYEFISDNEVSKTAGTMNRRYSEVGLFGVILDVLILAECDYIVCTLSSQVCRLAYELMQAHHTDASRLVYSLDDVYYFGGQQEHQVRAFHGHTKWDGGTLKLSKGDFMKIAGNEHNGFSVGTNQGRGRGFFPSYKLEEETLVANFPSYPEIM